MPTIAALTSFTANTRIKAAEVNTNFSSIRTTLNTYAAFVDLSATITGAWTFNTAPVFTNAQTFAAGVTITTGGLTVTAGASTFGAGVTVTGTVAATTFSGSGASLTNIPAGQLTGTIGATSGANLTNLNGSAIASGTVAQAYLPSTLTAITIGNLAIGGGGSQTTIGPQTTVDGAVLRSQNGAGSILDMRRTLDGGNGYLLRTSGTNDPEWNVGNNGVGSNSTPQGGPDGLTTYDPDGAVFFKIQRGGTDYYIRAERWT
jgi:hypothetical protein